jgi:hypothetical protein
MLAYKDDNNINADKNVGGSEPSSSSSLSQDNRISDSSSISHSLYDWFIWPLLQGIGISFGSLSLSGVWGYVSSKIRKS